MELIKSINEIKEKISSSSLTIGTFDGMHRGHIYLIDETLKFSNKDSNSSVVVTFNPNPFVVLNSINEQAYHLIEKEEKYDILNSLGINFLLELDFNEEMAEIGAQEFLKDFIVKPFNPKNIIIGHDHHFGKNRRGNDVFLKENESKHQYTLSVLKPFSLEGETVSSSAIRKLVKSGDMITANKYLGRNYKVKGKVVEGNGVGRELDFPTANIGLDTINQIIPKNGVYFVKIKINSDNYHGMCNIGCRPTVSSEDVISIEVHIFNYFKFDLYAQFIGIEFVDYVRSEKKFRNKEALKLQLIKDKEYCKSIQI